MKEADYINATNLAKLRIAADVLRTLIPQGEEETKDFRELAARAYQYVQKYEAAL